VKHPFAYFRLAGIDRSSLDLDHGLPLSRFRDRHVDYMQDLNVAIPIKSHYLIRYWPFAERCGPF
jgi:hypothetical protein